MLSFQAVVCALAMTAGGETVLLDFSADWCGPCQQMQPVVRQLAAAGYPIRAINIDQQPGLAGRFGVTSIPCFVMLVDGREVDRVAGATSQARLEQMLQAAGSARAKTPPIARAQSPEPSTPPSTARPSSPLAALAAVQQPGMQRPGIPGLVRVSATRTKEVDARLIASTVRLRITDADGSSVGSGTIIDSRAGEALILTCGHIFRSSQGKGKIAVDLFGNDAAQGLPARMVGYDLEKDIALVSIRPSVPVTVALLAELDYKAKQGEPVISVGCDHGADPTVQRTRVTAIDKFLGPSNLQVDGQPVQGRSGGGLFTADGRVIGVCNAADPADNEGLFAALTTIYGQLDKLGLSEMLASTGAPPSIPKRMPPAAAAAPSPAPATPGSTNDAGLSPSESDALAEIRARSEGAEVICIVRSLTDPRAKSEIIVLDRASAKFLEELAADRARQNQRQLTELRTTQTR
ncbi:MAG TPA: trypsin-like peptidase domain-containing protein [Pirellulales bacterium]|nr:trypsin-like peptidase domain-containing protein [Pirellulales bacterium]